MFTRFKRSWELGKQSLAVLREEKQLMLLPVMSSIACLLVLASFALPVALLTDWSKVQANVQASDEGARNLPMEPWHYALLFLFYFVNFFVITFFNSALVACAIRRFNGEQAGLKYGLQVAASRLPQIAGWALLSATVGVILKAIEERAGFIGAFVLRLIGMVWTIATFFVVPVLVVEGVGPIQAVKRSVAVLKKNWGETLVCNLGLSSVTLVAVLLGLAVSIGIFILGVSMHSTTVMILAGVWLVVWFIMIALVSSTLSGILLAATYQYGTTGRVPSGFNPNTLAGAFSQKKSKK